MYVLPKALVKQNCDVGDRLYAAYELGNVLDKKKENKRKLQDELGLIQNGHKFVI